MEQKNECKLRRSIFDVSFGLLGCRGEFTVQTARNALERKKGCLKHRTAGKAGQCVRPNPAHSPPFVLPAFPEGRVAGENEISNRNSWSLKKGLNWW
jgi:hypothetical protein